MKILKVAFILISVALAFGSAITAQTDTRASKTWEVSKYDISVALPAAENDRVITIKAVLSLRNVSSAAANSLSLRISPNAEISGIRIGEGSVDFSKNEEKIGVGSLQRIVIRSLSVPAGGALTASVDYRLRVDENSGLAALTPLGAQLLPMSFWYPTPNSWYFPRGADFAPYRVRVTAPRGQSIVSAGSLVADGGEQSQFGQPFFVSGGFDILSARNVEVFVGKGAGAEERKRAGEIAALTADARAHFEVLFGSSPSLPSRIVSVRRGSGYSDAGTLLLDENVLRRQKLDAQTAMAISESVVRKWIGATTAVSGDGSGAIREGLVRFLATEFIEAKFGKEVADIERLRQRTAYAAVSKRDAPLVQITPLDDYFFVTNSNKGAMIWRLLSKKVGADVFFGVLKAQMKTGGLDLAMLRGAFGQQKELLEYCFDKVTDVDLIVGLPQSGQGESRMALRNTGSVDAQVDITAITDKGEKLRNNAKIPALGFAETVFKTPSRIVRVEVDSDKLFPQLNYANDIKPMEIDESDALLFVKRAFDRQDFALAEKNARLVLADVPKFDDVRVLLARSLFAQGKTAEAEREYRSALDERLPSARTLAWVNVGLGEIALKNGQPTQAVGFYDLAVRAGAEFGASFAARQGRLRANAGGVSDESIKGFFADFDKAAVSANKAALEGVLLAGETPKAFATGIIGQAQEWTSKVMQLDVLDPQNVLVEIALNIRIINKSPESGTAVFRLTKAGTVWKLSGIESFEVR